MTLLTLSLFLSSCLVENSGDFSDIRSATYPDIAFTNATYQISRGDGNPLYVKGERIEIYNNINKMFLTNASFTQYNENKEVTLQGRFGEAQIDTRTNDIDLTKGVTLTIYPDELHIIGPSMAYNSDKNVVKGKDDEVITLSNKNGDILKGRGFIGDLKKIIFEFSHLEEGVLHYD